MICRGVRVDIGLVLADCENDLLVAVAHAARMLLVDPINIEAQLLVLLVSHNCCKRSRLGIRRL